MTWYNDNDRYVCAWLRNLVAAGEISEGVVDERPIQDISPADVAGHERAHWFAGIGGWDLALRLAGWGGPVWTGSCPCQPFSAAGKRQGFADERHLWPAWFRLIRECRPATIFGEQVAGAAGLEWWDAVAADLEDAGYACAAADLPAACVGAPHIRQRLWWVADRLGPRLEGRSEQSARKERETAERGGDAGGLGQRCGKAWPAECRPAQRTSESWSDAIWLPCRDGKARPAQPGIRPLVARLLTAMDGLGPVSRVGALRGAGNSIVPQLAAEFVRAYMEAREEA